MGKKYVYTFGGGKSDGDATMKNLLGGKGANLAEMSNLGIPVPAGMTVTTEVCTYYYDNDRTYPKELEEQVMSALKFTEKVMGAKFGDPANPLLLSVRSGARASMPGMMDTVLNLGLTTETIEGLIKKTNNERFVYDSYRRFIQMYGDVVMGADSEHFEKIIDELKAERGVKLDTELSAEDLKKLCELFKEKVRQDLGVEFPNDAREQLWGGIGAVFKSWNTERAVEYRRIHGYPSSWGTAVNVQAMVYGNMGDDCATGVAFTRDPSTGENRFYGEYLINAQGEDVVAGIRTPQPINIAGKKSPSEVSLEEAMPSAYKELEGIYLKLEKHYRNMQDIEFTIQQGKLWMLQTRNGKRTAAAAVKIAVDMVEEKLIDKKEAVNRVDPEQLDKLLHPTIDPKVKREVVARGLPASPGAAVGKIVFTADDADEWVKRGEKVILVRLETSPDDIKGMVVAEGILTARGGMTSHAAVVARGIGTCCVAGCSELQVDAEAKIASIGNLTLNEGDSITLDGSTGEVMLGELKTSRPELTGQFGTFMEWVDEIKKIKVRTNADTPHDAEVARKFGAEGIGLCRTEHMFFDGERIDAVREMILADSLEGRKKALAKILPMQKGDFKGIFRVMNGYPVTIRLLDPPLHEFLPHTEGEIADLSKELGVSAEKLRAKAEELHEVNPMLGHRGCRLGVTFPEIYAMQTQAIMEAACELVRDDHIIVIPEIEIPLVGHVNELRQLRTVCEKVAEEVIERTGQKVKYYIGTMIELPRAAITADEIAKYADFFSFGTNDLTQTTFGFSRDDAGKFIREYVDRKILPGDPFVSIDQAGVGKLMKIGVELGRKVNPKLDIGICGEHGGEAKSVMFCHDIGLNYVSCSPYRVPIARLAAAQAVLADENKQ
ncbi:MAG: pyruvate, phosphate dikinase [Myxococcales bacterium]|nr:pyruvate, phosphate dikinase [Myxococcales bacterium]